MRNPRMSYLFHEERSERGIRKIRKKQIKKPMTLVNKKAHLQNALKCTPEYTQTKTGGPSINPASNSWEPTSYQEAVNVGCCIQQEVKAIQKKDELTKTCPTRGMPPLDHADSDYFDLSGNNSVVDDDPMLNSLSDGGDNDNACRMENNPSFKQTEFDARLFDKLQDECDSETNDCTSEIDFPIDENDDDIHVDKTDEEMLSSMNELLHPYLTLTKAEVMFMIMNVFVRHNLSNAALSDILKLINIIVGYQAIPETFAKFSRFFTMKTYTRHYTCDRCGLFMGGTKSECAVCKSNQGTFFVAFDFATILKDIIRSNWEHIVAYRAEAYIKPNVTDILNAGVCKLKHLQNSITLVFNTDGVKIFNSNVKKSLWPIILCINELPPHLRFLRKNVVIAGLWLNGSEPDLDTFLKPFCDELEKLFADGLSIGKNIINRVQVIACCVDTKARCKIQNIKQFNGYNACGYCHHPGDIVGKQIRYGFKHEIPKRNHQETLHAMAISSSTGKPVIGIKGISPLIRFPGFDIIRNCPVDYMHCILLGIERQLCRIWLETPSSASYIKDKTAYIDEMLTSIAYFHEASRKARKISDRASWKANEWLQWLIHYSSICLQKYLPHEYFEHYTLLVSTVIKLLGCNIMPQTFDQCEKDLHKFVQNFERLYGIHEMTYNVHLLMHLVDCARDYGPLWTFSLFVFEDINGVLKKYIKGPNEPLVQIANRYILSHVSHSASTISVQSKVSDYCRRVKSNQHVDPAVNNKLYSLDDMIINRYNDNREFLTLRKFQCNGFLFSPAYDTTSNVKHKKKAHNDCYFSVQVDNSIIFGQIQQILQDDDNCYFLFKPILEGQPFINYFEIGSIEDEQYLVKVDESVQKYIKIQLENTFYLSKVHYTLHVD